MPEITEQPIPLTAYDEDRSALLEPFLLHKNIGLSEACVIVYYHSVIEGLKEKGLLTQVYEMPTILMPVPVYEIAFNSKSLTVVCPLSVGAPVAAGLIEELNALGCRRFMACGSAGALSSELARDLIIIPDRGLRDEGTSFHYAPPSRTIKVEPQIVARLEGVLKKHGVKYLTGMTWTIDAFYRETRQKVAKRRAEGCLTVEMEFAAFVAVAQFRSLQFGQYLMVGDDVSGDQWDSRGFAFHSPARERLFWLAAEAVLTL
jgi:uridine phosphorylase